MAPRKRGPAHGRARQARREEEEELDEVRRLLVARFGQDLEGFFRHPEVARMAVECLAEGRRIDEAALRAHLAGARLGFTAAQWDRVVCCLLYLLYDAFKQSKTASDLFFGGDRYRHLGYATGQRGCVVHVDGLIEDGDYCFDIIELDPVPRHDGRDWQRLHCEIIPCDQPYLQGFMRALDGMKAQVNSGAKMPAVRVSGRFTWDPEHTAWDATAQAFGPAGKWLEIHPVHDAAFIT